MADSSGGQLGTTAASIADLDRPALVRLAYRMLGSVEDAEDVVQEAQLKLLSATSSAEDPQAYLFRVVSNLAIDRLRQLKVQRRGYVGPWLPEPLETTDDGAADLIGAEDLDMALLLLLERLSPAERVAYVLREACDLDFREMARVLGVRADACRQRYHRARRKLSGVRRPPTPPRAQRRLLTRLSAAVMAADADALRALLSEDAVLLTDGGGRVSAAIRPVEDPARIARVLIHVAGNWSADGIEFVWLGLNGGAGLLIRERGAAVASVQVEADPDGERVAQLFVMRNPDKLTRLTVGQL